MKPPASLLAVLLSSQLGGTIMRRASLADIQQLVELMAEFYAESGYTLNRAHAAKAFATLLGDDHLGRVWFIQLRSMDVGYVVLTIKYGMEYGGLTAWVEDLFVREPFRNKGLATAAITELRAFCSNFGVRAISVEVGRDSGPAQTVYRRTGFISNDHQLMTLGLAEPTHANPDQPQ
jgi:GNAT superfamily N-acetyltransferase